MKPSWAAAGSLRCAPATRSRASRRRPTQRSGFSSERQRKRRGQESTVQTSALTQTHTHTHTHTQTHTCIHTHTHAHFFSKIDDFVIFSHLCNYQRQHSVHRHGR